MTQVKLQSELSDNLSIHQTPVFNYSELETETRVVVHKLTCEIKSLMRRSAEDIIKIGQKLVEVKQHLGHGSFIDWLKSEFNWSVSSATKFMQVWEQFKFVKFTNLNITASALYLTAAPSTPSEARAEVLKRASCGENITYTKTKAIVDQYKKIVKPKFENLDTVDISSEIIENDYSESTEATHDLNCSSFSELDELNEKEVKTEELPLLVQDLEYSSEFINKQNAIISKENISLHQETIQMLDSILSRATISQEILDILTSEIAIGVKNLLPEHMALIIRKSATSGLSNQHLEAILTEVQYILSERQQLK